MNAKGTKLKEFKKLKKSEIRVPEQINNWNKSATGQTLYIYMSHRL